MKRFAILSMCLLFLLASCAGPRQVTPPSVTEAPAEAEVPQPEAPGAEEPEAEAIIEESEPEIPEIGPEEVEVEGMPSGAEVPEIDTGETAAPEGEAVEEKLAMAYFPGIKELEAELKPGLIKQGDPFLVKIMSSRKPVVVFMEQELAVISCGGGCFAAVGAIDVENEPGRYSLTVSNDDETRTMSVRVSKGIFPVTRITVDEEKVELSPANEARADREAEMLRKFWAIRTERLWEGGFVMPLRNSFSTRFGTKRIFNDIKESVHTGLDIRGRNGEPIRASNRGRVVVAENLFFGGNTIVLDHGQGIYTVYMHLQEFSVKVDDLVGKGDVIGLVGQTGRATGPHLHFGVKVGPLNANPVSMTKLPLYGL